MNREIFSAQFFYNKEIHKVQFFWEAR